MQSFLKRNSLDNDSLFKEKEGLELLQKELVLANNGFLNIPKVLSCTKEVLELEAIETSRASKEQMQGLGEALAILHKKEFDNFGFSSNNYIGLSKQKNIFTKNWAKFFLEYRLAFQIGLVKCERTKKQLLLLLKNSQKEIEELLSCSSIYPSLVHGDLWSGNVLFSKQKVYLIDPSIHYAHREVDLAMSELFGGFTKEFYFSYEKVFPLEKEYEKRKIIYNLYHLLNHYNLFGESYLSDTLESFERIKNF